MRRATTPIRVVWRKHRTPRSIARAYFGGMGAALHEVTDEDGTPTAPAFLEGIEREGMWAFAETKASPPVVHYWIGPKRTLLDVAFLLGHELGHATGKKLKRFWPEEERADTYGAVAAAVLRKLLRGGR